MNPLSEEGTEASPSSDIIFLLQAQGLEAKVLAAKLKEQTEPLKRAIYMHQTSTEKTKDLLKIAKSKLFPENKEAPHNTPKT